MPFSFIELLTGDLHQAKRIPEKYTLSWPYFCYLFAVSRTCRLQSYVRLSSQKKWRWLARIQLQKRFIEIGDVRIGRRFFMPHPQCIIISSGVDIGNNVHVGQYVTIGGNFKKVRKNADGSVQKLPRIGSRVMIHPGAVIGGPVVIGDDVIIGANSVVTQDVPSNTIVIGNNKHLKYLIEVCPEGGSYSRLSTLE